MVAFAQVRCILHVSNDEQQAYCKNQVKPPFTVRSDSEVKSAPPPPPTQTNELHRYCFVIILGINFYNVRVRLI